MLRSHNLSALWRGPRLPWLIVALIMFGIIVTWISAGCTFTPTRSKPRPTTPSTVGTGKLPKPLQGQFEVSDEDAFVRGNQKIKPTTKPGEIQDADDIAVSRPAGAAGDATKPAANDKQFVKQPEFDQSDDFVPPRDDVRAVDANPYNTLDEETRKRQQTVREAMQHAFGSYTKYAWGTDELRPQSRNGMEWLNLGATIVDSLDTLWIMDLKDDFERAREWVAKSLSFDKPIEVSVFETTIRVVGGLCAAFDLSGDRMFLNKARDIADRLSWAFNTSTGIPYASVHLQNHGGRSPGWTGGASILSEMGTMQLEYKHLAHHLNNRHYYNIVERVIDHLDRLNKPVKGLYPIYVSPHNGGFTTASTTYGALGDSFYEYILKQWLFTGRTEQKYKRMYEEIVEAAMDKLLKRSEPSKLLYIAEWNGFGTTDKMDHLACFVGGMFALGAQYSARDPQKELEAGEGIGETCYQFYHRMPSGLSPELVHFRQGSDFQPGASHYILRPETVETLFYLWRLTHNQKWRDHGWEIMQSLNRNCRTDAGYAGLRDVTRENPPKDDQQQSFFLAETLKYLYLLFSPDDLISLDDWVFNTEAHPLRKIPPPSWV